MLTKKLEITLPTVSASNSIDSVGFYRDDYEYTAFNFVVE